MYVGFVDGSGVGAIDGRRVGKIVGCAEGDAVGIRVGETVGVWDGVTVGVAEGVRVGVAVGGSVGCACDDDDEAVRTTSKSDCISLSYVRRWFSGGRPCGRSVSGLKVRRRSGLAVEDKEEGVPTESKLTVRVGCR